MWFLQMAQLSTTMSHDQRQTAFHCQCEIQEIRGQPDLDSFRLANTEPQVHTFLTWKRGCLVVGESTSIGAFSAIVCECVCMPADRYRVDDDDGKDEKSDEQSDKQTTFSVSRTDCAFAQVEAKHARIGTGPDSPSWRQKGCSGSKSTRELQLSVRKCRQPTLQMVTSITFIV